MFSPIIKEPVFECAEHVVIASIEAGTEITILSGANKIGVAIAASGSESIRLDRPLVSGEQITAVSKMGGQQSKPSVIVTVQRLPAPLPTPICLSVLYVGSIGVETWGMVPGSKATIVSGNEVLGEETATRGEASIYLKRPLTAGDIVSLFATMGSQQSTKTPAITPVMPFGSGVYSEKLPPPSVMEPLQACNDIVNVSGMVPGGQMWINVDNLVMFRRWSPRLSFPVQLPSELKENQLVTAQQSFDILHMTSDLSNAVRVGPTANLPAPNIFVPIYEGDSSIILQYLLNSVKVEIAVNGKTVGSADYEGNKEFDPGIELVAGQKITARQGKCGHWSPWSNEAVVQERPDEPAPPTVKGPLYEGANFVPVEDRVDGAWVKVFADDILIGKEKLGLVEVVPHLIADKNITATQTLGNLESGPSQPVVVQRVPELLPAPDFISLVCPPGFISVSVPYVRLYQLIPGAQVNVFWNKLLIASGETIDTKFDLPLSISPWPGTKVHAVQKLSDHLSKDSNVVTAVGKLLIVSVIGQSSPWGTYARPNDNLTVKVQSETPVRSDLKVTVSSSDPNVVKVLGSADSIIPATKKETIFMLQGVAPGVAKIGLDAENYYQSGGWTSGGYWLDPQFGPVELEIWGGMTVDKPVPDTLKVGESFVSIVATDPWSADRKLKLHTDHGYVSVPSEIIIPAGTKGVLVTGKALTPGHDRIFYYIEHYQAWDQNRGTFWEIDVQSLPKPTQPTPQTTSYKLRLDWKAPFPSGTIYAIGLVSPVPNGKLKKVRNCNDVYPWEYDLWVPTFGTSNDYPDPKKGYSLKKGKEATPAELLLPESMTNGLTIPAVPVPLNSWTFNQGVKGLVYVELIYEV